MIPHNARFALDDIRRFQGKTHDALIRQSFALPFVIGMLLLFLEFASFDLPEPWANSARMIGCGAAAVTLLLLHSRSPIQGKFAGPELVVAAGWSAGFILAFIGFRITTWALALPIPATIAAAATVVAGMATNPLVRRIYSRLLQREPQGRPMNPFFHEFLHVPVRLSIVALLAPATWVEVGFLGDMIKTGDSALRKEISALAEAGYVSTRNGSAMGYGRMYVQLTPLGRQNFQRHAAALKQIVAVA
ncbi:transcriptional regulator [Nonomuraea sp. NPDC050680]|uniref:transcriptional regulator n=1 Tax=Nonomuraea sp. NPDC050680 TaxID=3154630 RepID=UPI0033E431C1